MSFLTTLASIFGRRATIQCRRYELPTPKQTGRKADGIRILMARGYITQEDLRLKGDNSPAKTIWRMRRDGVLKLDANDPTGFRDVPNRDGKGIHRQYLWTGRVPAGWPQPERRSVTRGGR